MSTTDVDVALTPLALELKAYFRARVACLQADPPCAVRPCARHHAEAATALGSVRCEACRTLGIVAHSGRGSDGFDPCEDCDGYGRTWPTAASTVTGGPATTGAVDGVVAERRSRPTTPPSDSSPPPASHAEGGGTGHRYGPEESMP